MATSVFYSSYYEHDIHRIQLVRNINAIEARPILTTQEWEEVERGGDDAIKKWIHHQMAYKTAVIVLVGKHTASRVWVISGIEKARADKKPLLGIRIHRISSLGDVDAASANPFGRAHVGSVPVFDPTTTKWTGKIDNKKTYVTLKDCLEHWPGKRVTKPSW